MKLFSLLAVLFAMASCAILPEVQQFNTYYEIERYIYDTIEYKEDPFGFDQWQSPGKTLDIGTGDCEDEAILFLYCAYKSFGIKGKIALCRTPYGDHACAIVDGYIFGEIDGQKIIDHVRYDDAMAKAVLNDL